jgi:acyl carrier protein
MNQNGSISPVSVDFLKSWLSGWMAHELATDPGELDTAQTFLSYGLDSVQAMSMVGDLEAKFSRRLNPTLAWDYPTIDALAQHLADHLEVAAPPESLRSVPKPVASRTEIEKLLNGIDLIEDHEVDRLLAKYLDGST